MSETTLVYPLQWVWMDPSSTRGIGGVHKPQEACLIDGEGQKLAQVKGGALRAGKWSGNLERRDRPSLRRSTFLVEGQLFGPAGEQLAVRAEFKRRSVREIIVEIGERSFLMQRCGVVHQARHIADMDTGDRALMLIEIIRPKIEGLPALSAGGALGASGVLGGASTAKSGGAAGGVPGGAVRGARNRRRSRPRRARGFVRAHSHPYEHDSVERGVGERGVGERGCGAGRGSLHGSLHGLSQELGALKIPAARELTMYEIAVLCWVSAQVDMTWLEMRG